MRQEIAEVLDLLIQEGCIVCGDFNSTTCSHDNLNDLDEPTAGHDNVWRWLQNLEGNGKIIEVFKEAWMKLQMQDTVPMTRVRHYAGSSYIDEMYVTRNRFCIFQPRDVCRSDVKLKGKFGSSHNFHALSFLDRAIPQKPTNRCYGWGEKQIKLFKSKMRGQFNCCPTDVEHGVKWLNNAIVQAFHSVQDCSPNVEAKTPDGWERRIENLANLARRNQKIFLRRAKAEFLIPMKPSGVPVPIHQIEMTMNVHNPWDAVELSVMHEHEEKSILVPTDEDIRQWARVSRCKVPGPDNVPPFLYYVLPDNVFHWVCDIVRAIIRGELRLDILRETVLFRFSKRKEDLSVSNAWRPISITSALYRIVFRCIRSFLETTLAPSLSGRQYTGRKGGIRELLELGVEPFVFMNDLAIVAETAIELRHALIHAQMRFARIGPSVNFGKTKI